MSILLILTHPGEVEEPQKTAALGAAGHFLQSLLHSFVQECHWNVSCYECNHSARCAKHDKDEKVGDEIFCDG